MGWQFSQPIVDFQGLALGLHRAKLGRDALADLAEDQLIGGIVEVDDDLVALGKDAAQQVDGERAFDVLL